MSEVTIREFKRFEKTIEIHWHAGFFRDIGNQWRVWTVVRDIKSGEFAKVGLSLGYLPMLPLGMRFEKGIMLTPQSGEYGTALIESLADGIEITSDQLPKTLYSFGRHMGGVQRLFRFDLPDQTLYVTVIELVRYFLLHNRTLAEQLMVPGGLSQLHHPQLPGHYKHLSLRFTAEMPVSALDNAFAKEFAWVAVHPDGRRMWDSVQQLSDGQPYVRAVLPDIRNSEWQYWGVRNGRDVLVQEILDLSGRTLPCHWLQYSHPGLKQPARVRCKSATTEGGGNGDKERATDKEVHLSGTGRVGGRLQQTPRIHIPRRTSSFQDPVTVEKVWARVGTQTVTSRAGKRKGPRRFKFKRLNVSVGAPEPQGNIGALEFNLLKLVDWEHSGTLQAMLEAIKLMPSLCPGLSVSTGLCELKQGRVFSLANRHPRTCLVAIFEVNDGLPVVVLDVDRTGDKAVSTLLLRYPNEVSLLDIEQDIKLLLDCLVDASGRWDHAAEEMVSRRCDFQRLSKLIPERTKTRDSEELANLAQRLLHRLGFWREE